MENGLMTKKNKSISKTCPGCSKNKVLRPVGEIELCSECKTIAEVIQNRPEQIESIKSLLSPQETSHELPDVLDAVRYRTSDRDRNTWYVSVSELEGEPVEIFASTAFDRDQHLQSRISNLTTITRLISLILRHISMGEKLTLEKTLTQLHRSSRQRNDLPEMLVDVLSKYCKKPQEIQRDVHETP